jgi:hypothetical protein
MEAKQNPSVATIEAIQLLAAFTRDRFDIWMLAGSGNAAHRARLMGILLSAKTTQAKSGVNAIRDAFYERLQITGECIAHREDNFREACRYIVGHVREAQATDFERRAQDAMMQEGGR